MKPKVVNVAEAKARAKLVGLGPAVAGKRVPGKGKGRFRTKKGFDGPLPDDLLALFEGPR
jgi:hypothetical protein